jgi:hypothetical protein
MNPNDSAPAPVATEGEGRKTDQLASEITFKNNATTGAVQELAVHPAANVFPLLEGEEFDALVANVREYGLKNPVTLYHGAVIDGRNRMRACLAAGWSWRAIRGMCVELSGTGAGQIDDPVAYVISLNLHRRHLTAEQKRELIAKLIKAQPEKSDRQIGREIKADNKTVAAVRSDLERREEIPYVEARTDTKGRKQPAKKKTNAAKARREKERARREEKRKRDAEEYRRRAAEINARIELLAVNLVKADRDQARQLYDFLNGGFEYEFERALRHELGLDREEIDNGGDAGNGVDPESSAEAMKAKMAALDAAEASS